MGVSRPSSASKSLGIWDSHHSVFLLFFSAVFFGRVFFLLFFWPGYFGFFQNLGFGGIITLGNFIVHCAPQAIFFRKLMFLRRFPCFQKRFLSCRTLQNEVSSQILALWIDFTPTLPSSEILFWAGFFIIFLLGGFWGVFPPNWAGKKHYGLFHNCSISQVMKGTWILTTKL